MPWAATVAGSPVRVLVDTNALVRFLTGAPADQARRVRRLFERADAAEIELVTVPSVIAEFLYVLIDYYELPRREAFEAVSDLCATRVLTVEHEPAVLDALAVAAEGDLDFVDALLVHLGGALGAERVFSFDRGMQQKLSKTLPVGSDPEA